MKRILAIFMMLALFCSAIGCKENISVYLRQLSQEEQLTFLQLYSRGSEMSQAYSDTLRIHQSNTATVSDNQDTCDDLIESNPRGLSCLHCLHPAAREQAKVIVETLNKSCLKNIALSYLIDGTFGTNYNFIIEDIEKISEGRTIFLELFLLNGSSQRRWQNTPIDALFTRTKPEDFRKNLIQHDHDTFHILNNYLNNLTPLLDYLNKLNVKVLIVPMLEDNLDNQSFEILQNHIAARINPAIDYTLGRNPCPNCYPGNQIDFSNVYFLEQHLKDPAQIKAEIPQVITNDGWAFSFNSQSPIQLADLLSLRDAADLAGAVFILWNAEFQGLGPLANAVNIHPNDRNYVIPSKDQQAELIYFLQGY